jgi:hypothetical protein
MLLLNGPVEIRGKMATCTDLLQGTLDLLILKTLDLEPMHGWGIALRIQQVSKEEVTTPNVENRALRMLKLSSIPSKLPQPGFIAADCCLPENEAAILRL